jgi:thioester reductase-like protein
MGHPVDCIHCAPTLIENMYEYTTDHGGDFSPLRSLKILQPGGAALSDDIVQALVAKGVNVKTTYGSTEIGPPFRSIPPTLNNPKCYTFRNLYPDNPFLKMEEVGEGLYECVVHKGFELAAELWEGKPDDEAYRTNDLFIQDPPGSGFFVLQGRKDDILVHSNGENTSAGPLQLDIQTASKIIYKALALGNSRPCVSLLVEVHAEYDPANELIQDQIWETVQQVNTRYPTHSQIMRHMIHILPKGSTLAVTPKGNVKRKEAERVYAPEIAQLYSDDSSSPLFPTSSSSSTEPLSEFLRHTLSSLSNIPVSQIEDYTTLYDLGIDSRLALSLRSSLSHHLKRSISLSTLFENPSISQLVSVFSPPTPSSSLSLPLTSPKSTSTQVIQGLISKLSAEFAFWPQRSLPSIYPPVTKETILLTGGSGSLGTALLETLTASPAVSKIYAMMRGTNHFLKLQKSLESRGMDTSILGDGNGGGKVQVLNFSMQDPLLGLGIEEYAILAKDVTVVVGNAWKMDFNAAVGEFEGDCLRSEFCPFPYAPIICHTSYHWPSWIWTTAFTNSSQFSSMSELELGHGSYPGPFEHEMVELTTLTDTMHLLRLCLAGRPKTFAFTSSISTCMGPGHTELSVKEEAIGEDPSVTLGTGYAQSKYIGIFYPSSSFLSPHLACTPSLALQISNSSLTRTAISHSRLLRIMANTKPPKVERLLQLLPPHLSHHIPIKLLRVGQLCATGHWNTNEMWPILFATSFHPSINAIPLFLKKSVDWIPVDVAARTICEVLLAETLLNAGNAENNGGHAVHNIVNPHRISWSSLVSMLQSTKVSTGNDKMEEVTMAEWVGRLNALAEKGVDPNEVPGLRLLGFFEDMVGDEEESKVFETEKTRGISKNLRECEGMKREWIENNVRVWRESGFLI